MKIFLLFILFCSCANAEKFSEILTWIPDFEELELGMSVNSFLKERPDAQSLDPTQREIEKFSGAYFEQNIGSNPAPSEGSMVLYNFKNGIMSSVFWVNKESNSLGLTKNVRNLLLKNLGLPEIGYVAKIQKNKISKITHEIFPVPGSSTLNVSLSSSPDGLEIAVLDFEVDPENDTDLLFRSYDAQSTRFLEKGLEHADAEEVVDLLQEIIDEEKENISSEGKTQKRSEKETEFDTGNKSNSLTVDKKNSQQEKNQSLTWLYWVLGVVILGGVAKLILGSRR